MKSIERALRTIDESEDIECVWYLDEAISYLKDIDEGLWKVLDSLKAEYRGKICQLVEGAAEGGVEKLLGMCDAFYGNPGKWAHFFRNNRKPVMIQSAEL